MYRGTTPTFVLNLEGSVDLTDAHNVYATFYQKGVTITKTGDDIEIHPTQVEVYFTQEESLKFKTGAIQIQVNWTYSNGSRSCTDIASVSVDRNLIGEVLK